MKKTDIGVVGFMYAVCVLFFVMTLKLKKAAQTYPLFIILLLFLLTTLYVIQMVIGAKKNGVTSGLEDFADFLPKQFFPVLILTIGYLVLMYFAGFYISTAVFMVVCLVFLRVKPIMIVLSTLFVLALVYGAFTMFLGVKLPQGMLFG